MAVDQADGQYAVEGVADMLGKLLGAAPWDGAKLHLYKSSFAPAATNVAADFIAAEADYAGYAPIALTYSAIGVDGAGNPTVLSNRCFFQATDGVTPNTIGGCWVQADTTGPPATHEAVQFYQFAIPIPLASALAFLGVVLSIGAPGNPGSAIVDH